MNFFGIGQSADIDIVFDGADARKFAEVKLDDGRKDKFLLYYDGETVSGRVNVTLKKPGSKLEHQGIRIDLIGQIELYFDRGNHHEFLSLVKELARPGDLIQNTNYPFEFANVEKPYEVYVGSNVRLRYFLRVTITRRITDIVREIDVAVHTLCSYPELSSPIKMEVGIEDCLHIEFEYNKSKYHLRDVIVGKIYFLLVRIKIKHMEIAIIKRETTGSGPNTFTENETIAKYEIMDGAPVKGESIPIRVFLAGYDLTPTMRDINKKFSVRYFLNLVLMDTEDRRYFKQQEITLWRKADKSRKSALTGGGGATNNPHVPSHLVGSDGEIMPKQPQAVANAHQQPSGVVAYPGSRGGLANQPLGNDEDDDDDDDDEEYAESSAQQHDEVAQRRSRQQHDALDGEQGGEAVSSTTATTTMGLFTQENSPIQESRMLPTDASVSSLAASAIVEPSPSAAPAVASNLSSPSSDSLFADVVEVQRGLADGAAASQSAALSEPIFAAAAAAAAAASPAAIAAAPAEPVVVSAATTSPSASIAAKPTIAAKPSATKIAAPPLTTSEGDADDSPA